MAIDERVIAITVKMLERVDKFTEKDKMRFAHDLMVCPCLCARTMKDVLSTDLFSQLLNLQPGKTIVIGK